MHYNLWTWSRTLHIIQRKIEKKRNIHVKGSVLIVSTAGSLLCWEAFVAAVNDQECLQKFFDFKEAMNTLVRKLLSSRNK